MNSSLGIFKTLFWRILFSLLMALLAILFLNKVAEQHFMEAVLKRQLDIRATWINAHIDAGDSMTLFASNWQQYGNTNRFIYYNANAEILADSHTELTPLNLDIKNKKLIAEPSIYVILPTQNSTWIALIEMSVPRLAPHVYFVLMIAVTLVLILTALAIYPGIRSIALTFSRLKIIAGQTAEGNFGSVIEPGSNKDLNRVISSFNHMSVKLKEAQKLSSKMIANVSHELRSPLARIRLMTDTAKLNPEKINQLSDEINQEIELLDNLVGKMLFAAKFDAEEQFKFTELSLAPWLLQITQRVKPKLDDAGINLSYVDIPSGLIINADPIHLTQAITNIIDNAQNALSGMENGKISIESKLLNNFCEIHISNNGPKIPEDHLPFIFERFYQVSEHRGHGEKGSGLGLSIVRSIILAHQGEVQISNNNEVGVLVIIRLPLLHKTI